MTNPIAYLLSNAWLERQPQVRPTLLALLVALGLGGTHLETGPRSGFLERVGAWPGYTRGPAWDVATAGHYAYVAIGDGGLAILDMTDPSKPVRVGGYLPGGRTEMVRVVGSRAYLATMVRRSGGGCAGESQRGHLVILDVSDPAKPAPLGRYITDTVIRCLHVDGDQIYLSEGDDGEHDAGFRLLSVSNPARPAALRVDQPSVVHALWASGALAYVGRWNSIEVLDVSQPASPAVVMGVDVPMYGEVRAMQLVGDYLYVTGGWFGPTNASSNLTIYDVSTVNAPRYLGDLHFSQVVMGLQVAGDYAFLAMADAGLVAIDVSDPAKPVEVGTWDTPGAALQVGILRGNAVVADYHGGLQVIDVRDPRHMSQVASFDTGLTARTVRVRGERVYLLSADRFAQESATLALARSRVEALDVSNPTKPQLLGIYEGDCMVEALDVSGELAYLGWIRDLGAGRSALVGLDIIDFHDPSAPVWLSTTTNGILGAGLAVRLNGQYAYVTTSGLDIFDVSDPTKPVRLRWIGCAPTRDGLRVVGNHAYLSSDCGLEVLDVTKPRGTTVVGSVQFSRCESGTGGLSVMDGYAYIGQGWDGFSVVAVRDPTKPAIVGGHNTLGQVANLWVEGRYAYVAEGEAGLEVFDVSNPAKPFLIGRSPIGGQACGVEVSGDHVYVAESWGGLAILSLPSEAVTVVEDPANVRVAFGDTATLTVRAVGRGPLSYHW